MTRPVIRSRRCRHRQQLSYVGQWRRDLNGHLSSAGLRQREGDNLLIPFQDRFPALNRSQLPALIVLADPEPEDRFGRLIQKYPESLIVACNGADQRDLRTFRLSWFGYCGHFRDSGGRDRRRRRPPGW